MFLTYLLIGLLLAGCTAPETQENNFFLLPPVTLQVTPRPGWTVTYQLQHDILFQRPLEWQKGNKISGFNFEGPNGGYISFSDGPTMSENFNDAVEKTCLEEIAFTERMKNKLGSKPYGENPQLTHLQVDGQPACLILPSADQDEQFKKRAFMAVEYPKNLFLEPGTPRYLGLLADSGHIQSFAETIRFIPRPKQLVEPEPLPQSASFSPTLSGSLTLKNQWVLSITLDETYIYWTINEQQDTIFRAPLAGGAVEKIVTSKDKDGSVIAIPPVRGGDWLIYVESVGIRENANWELRAKNLRDGSEQVVLKGSGNEAYQLNISVDNVWVAWSRTVPNGQGTCDESILGLSNLRTGEQVELDRVCTDQYMWSIVSLSNQTLVAEQDFPDAKGGGSSLHLFENFHTDHHKALTTDGRVSMPRVSSPWVVWKNALRFNWGYTNSIYEMESETQQVVMITGGKIPDPKLTGNWLYWVIENSESDVGGLCLYNLKKKQVWIMAPKQGVLSTVAIYGDWAVWSRREDFSAGGDSVLEWAKLP